MSKEDLQYLYWMADKADQWIDISVPNTKMFIEMLKNELTSRALELETASAQRDLL